MLAGNFTVVVLISILTVVLLVVILVVMLLVRCDTGCVVVG